MVADDAVRFAILEAALLCGGLLAAYSVFLTVLFPFVSSMIWQSVLGPAVVSRWPDAGQNKLKGLPSYMPLDAGDPYVIAWGLLPPPLDDVTHSLRDGLLLGVGMALLPGLASSALLTAILFIVMAKWVWRITQSAGSMRTDNVFWAIKELLLYAGAIAAISAAGYIN